MMDKCQVRFTEPTKNFFSNERETIHVCIVMWFYQLN